MNYIKVNQEAWDKRTSVHVDSEMYGVDGFLRGDCKLKEIELSALPDVRGKQMLHLQCHFGIDTLCWARRGAIVTGVDLSSAAIEKANELKEKAGLEAKFVCSDIYEYGKEVSPEFDIVFVSYGALCWLPDVKGWANIVARSLMPGGKLVLVEFHPFHDLHAGYSYFEQNEPDLEESGTYTENCSGEKSLTATWPHPMGEVVNALIDAGIRIDRLKEYPFSPYNCFEGMEEKEPGRFFISKDGHSIPLVYSIKGTKAGE